MIFLLMIFEIPLDLLVPAVLGIFLFVLGAMFIRPGVQGGWWVTLSSWTLAGIVHGVSMVCAPKYGHVDYAIFLVELVLCVPLGLVVLGWYYATRAMRRSSLAALLCWPLAGGIVGFILGLVFAPALFEVDQSQYTIPPTEGGRQNRVYGTFDSIVVKDRITGVTRATAHGWGSRIHEAKFRCYACVASLPAFLGALVGLGAAVWVSRRKLPLSVGDQRRALFLREFPKEDSQMAAATADSRQFRGSETQLRLAHPSPTEGER